MNTHRRRCHRSRGRSRDGLWTWDHDGAIQPDEIRDNPLARPCPRASGGCGSAALEPCTRLARGRRVRMLGYHHARTASTPAVIHHNTPEPTPSASVGATKGSRQ